MTDQNNKELGLVDILQIFGQWIVSALKTMVEWGMYLLFFAFKQWKILLAAVVAIAIFTVVSYKMQDTQYEANMIVRCNAMETTQMKSFFDNYSSLLHNNILSEERINRKTGLTQEQCEEILSINTDFCIDDDRDGVMDKVDQGEKLKYHNENLYSLNIV